MNETHILQQNDNETQPPIEKIELSQFPEGKEIREKLDQEYNRRVDILRKVSASLGIPQESIMLAPPAADRTDFGYVADLDLIFFGELHEYQELSKQMHDTYDLLPFVIPMDQKRLAEIESFAPEFHQFLMDHKGNLPTPAEQNTASTANFFDIANDLEDKARTLLSPEQKQELKKQRLAIGQEFVDEVKTVMPVLGYNFSGSMMEDMDRFGVVSDLDIDFLTNPADEQIKRDAYDYIHVYLKSKYAEKYGIKVDISETTLAYAKKISGHDPKFVKFFKKQFGIDVTQKLDPEYNS